MPRITGDKSCSCNNWWWCSWSSICRALSLTSHEVKPDDLQAFHCLKKKVTVIVKFKCRKQKHSILIHRKNLRNKSGVLVGSSFRRACVMRTINYLINVDCWKMVTRFIPCGFGITLSMLNLMKEVKPQRFIMSSTMKNFLELTI